MSWLSKAKNKVKKWQPGKTQFKDVGKALKTVAPIVMGLTGIGLPFAAAAGAALSAVGEGKKANLGTVIKGGLSGAAAGATGGQLGSLMKAGKGVVTAAASGGVKGAGSQLGTLMSGGAKGAAGALNTVKNAAKVAGAVKGVSAVGKANKSMKKDQTKARELAGMSEGLYGQMAQGATDRYAENDAMRQAFRHGVMNGADPSNPFARKGAFDQFQKLATQDVMDAGPDTRTAVPREGGSAGMWGGGGLLGKMRGDLMAKSESLGAPPQINMFGGGVAGGGLMAKMAGRIKGGRKIGMPVNRAASSKGVPNNSVMDQGYDQRDDDLYSRMA